jgi:hypothetical protein
VSLHRIDDLRMRLNLVAGALAVVAFAAALPVPAAYAASSIHAIISQYTLAAGFTPADVSAMKKIADYESHDHTKGGDGHNYGLFQLSRSICKGKPWKDPVWNTKRALRYVKGRFKTPVLAWAHIKKTGWY